MPPAAPPPVSNPPPVRHGPHPCGDLSIDALCEILYDSVVVDTPELTAILQNVILEVRGKTGYGADDYTGEDSECCDVHAALMHYGSMPQRNGCTGPLCGRWNQDRVREAHRISTVQRRTRAPWETGRRRTGMEAKHEVLTTLAVALMAVSRRRVPTSLIEMCRVDGVPVPDTPEFKSAERRWKARERRLYLDT